MGGRVYNVLFLCTGNSARSILAELLTEHWGKERFKGYSAGSFPGGTVHPLALDLLEARHLRTYGLRSKGWNEFAGPGAPVMDFVFMVCDQAAGEACPVWPGNPVTAHWGVPDPAAVQGTEAQRRRAFLDGYVALENRIRFSSPCRSTSSIAWRLSKKWMKSAACGLSRNRSCHAFGR